MNNATNKNLKKAKQEKNDEFYTQLKDIEKELKHYKEHFNGKTVFCNCDNPNSSNFWKFFSLNFNSFGLKKLISTYYEASALTYKTERTGMTDDDLKITPLRCNGDFRSDDVIDILMESDIVVTNPPFSLLREYIAQLMNYGKDFLVIGNVNAITYKEIFPLIKNGHLWLGYNSGGGNCEFLVPEQYPLYGSLTRTDENSNKYITVTGIRWFTNLNHSKRNQPIELYHTYRGHESDYPRYDNYDAIEVSKVKNIPCDYDGVMGVPITFLDKYCSEQFEIIGMSKNGCNYNFKNTKKYDNYYEIRQDGSKTGFSGKTINEKPVIYRNNGKNNFYINSNGDVAQCLYARIFIRNKIFI